MAYDIRNVKTMTDLIGYFSQNLQWNIDVDDFDDIEDISYDFDAEDIGLKEEAFAKISSLRQLQPLVDGQRWGIFCVEFDSDKFEVTALRKILSGLVPKRRNSADHAVWDQKDLMFICTWGKDNNRTIGIAHFEDKDSGLPQIKMISCAPAMEDFTQIKVFEDRLSQLTWPRNANNIDAWRESWASAFVSGYRQTIHDSVTLTVQLAAEAQNIRDRIMDILEVESRNGYVHLLYEKFRNTLIHDMTEQQFADMYAQTVVYGLFSARCMDDTQEDFSADEAIDCIPNTNPFLKSLMKECLGSENNTKLSFDELEISNVVELLRNTRIEAIIQDFNRQTGGGREDPVIHFYEEFLTAYDKAQKVQRGVYYTPQPVVNFMVRAVDSIIKEQFGLCDGLASEETKKIKVKRQSKKKQAGFYKEVDELIDVPAIQVLDPAAGTGTFLRQTILQIYENFKAKHKGLHPDQLAAEWNKYVPEQLLPRLNGFELMMAPYAVAHMKLAMILKDTGYDFSGDTRLNVYLTNSLEEAGTSETQMTLFDDPLAWESVEANGVKKNLGINVVIGNPPYSGESANKGEYILGLMDDYKKEPGGLLKLQERNPKWINDDYVKFIRYAQEVIGKSQDGILAYICPHGFLDNPTFRGMRWWFTQTFRTTYIIDLHGNAKKKETAPDGSKDENVFDIQQGVCIVLGIHKGTRKSTPEVYHADLYGLRNRKYEWLNRHSLEDIAFERLLPESPQFFFVPKDLKTGEEYLSSDFFGIDELFNISSVGFVSARDGLCIQDTYDQMHHVVSDFSSLNSEVARSKYNLKNDVRDWQVAWAQRDINIRKKKNGDIDESYICEVSYRPFDQRYTYYTGESRGFQCYPRYETLSNMKSGDNLALCTTKVLKASKNWHHVFVADKPLDSCYVSNKTSEITYAFPLYIKKNARKFPNFDQKVIDRFSKAIGEAFCSNGGILNAESIFGYIYAYLHSQTYRNRYLEFLKIGFPRIPYPTSQSVFNELSRLGQDLIELHLEKNKVNACNIAANIQNNVVTSADYKSGRVYINKTSWFEVPETIWQFEIGCYQIAMKWLKDRKGKALTGADIEHYKQIISRLSETQRIMKEVDVLIES